MAYIPDEVIEEVRNRFDIVEVVSSYIDLKKAGKNFVGFCPFHSEKSPSFTVSPEKQIFYCFGCQTGGNLFSFVMQMEDCSFPDAVRFLAQRSGITIDPVPSTPAEKKELQIREVLGEMHSLAQKYFQNILWKTPRGKEVLDYLSKRGLTKQSVTDFQVGYTGNNREGLTGELRRKGFDLELAVKGGLVGKNSLGRYYDYFRERLIFPIWDSQGRVAAFGGRIWGQGEPKYLNSPESPLFNKSRTLYAFHLALPHIRREKKALLVEGYMDVILLHQHGIKETVAPMGTALTEKQLSLLRGRLNKVVLVFDADTGGEIAALRGLELLKNEGCMVEVAQLPQGWDPADFVKEHGGKVFHQEILQQARSLVDYRLFTIKKRHDLKKEEGRVNYWKEARKVLGEIQETLEREEYLKKIAGEIDVSLEVLRGDLENIIRSFPAVGKKAVVKEAAPKSVSLKELVERELFTCIFKSSRYLKELKKLNINADSFLEGPHREIARVLYEMDQQGKEINTAAVLSYFSEQEMHKLIIKMVLAENLNEEDKMEKIFRDCARKIKTLCWTDERERLIKSLQNTVNREEISAKLQRIRDLKKWEEELYHSGEGEDFDV
ncbi:MAG: DNA primase [Dethiobacter sp.]|jgi:DNA primase|nr:MAG: DNA primase [Dethiobacter sp.]